jgi:hypothetical protein
MLGCLLLLNCKPQANLEYMYKYVCFYFCGLHGTQCLQPLLLRCLLLQANLEYMYKHFGFYLPDSEFLQDPEGLLKYLGAKLTYGKVGLGVDSWRACGSFCWRVSVAELIVGCSMVDRSWSVSSLIAQTEVLCCRG